MMAEGFEQELDEKAFRLELKKSENCYKQILWHAIVDGEKQTFTSDPYTGFWRRFGIGFMGLFPIESQL